MRRKRRPVFALYAGSGHCADGHDDPVCVFEQKNRQENDVHPGVGDAGGGLCLFAAGRVYCAAGSVFGLGRECTGEYRDRLYAGDYHGDFVRGGGLRRV